MHNRYILAIVLGTGLLLSACTDRIGMSENGNNVAFSLKIDNATRSSLGVDENSIEDICILAYRDGLSAGNIFTADLDDILMYLEPGEYHFYALANMGGPISQPDAEEELTRWRYSVNSSSELASPAIVFAGYAAGTVSRTGGNRFILPVTRLVAKCGFRFDSSALPGMEVKSARLCQAALDMAPFSSDPSTPLNVEETGDYASEADLEVLNSGGSIYFYTLENAQGELLPGNADQWAKVPDNIPDKAGQCTYIEVVAHFGSASQWRRGTVRYRFFLGKDTTSDFTVLRNTDCIVEMTASEEGLGRESWLIDTSEMNWDALYGFSAPAFPEYAGQWSVMEIPLANENSTVTVSNGEESFTIGTDSGDGYSSICLPDGNILYYVPDISRTKVFIYASAATPVNGSSAEDSGITLTSSAGTTINVRSSAAEWPEYIITDADTGEPVSSLTLNEDGYDAVDFNLQMGDRDGNVLPLSDFAVPDEALAGIISSSGDDSYGNLKIFVDDFINSAAIGKYSKSSSAEYLASSGCAGGSLSPEDAALISSSGIAAKGVIYGSGDGSGNMTLGIGRICDSSAYFGILNKIDCTVNAAFPDQRFLGEFENTQLEINGTGRDDHLQELALDIYSGNSGSSGAVWTVSRVDPAAGKTPNATLYSKAKSGHDNLSLSFTGDSQLKISLLPPQPDTQTTSNPFFACGAFCIRGSVTNPHTGKTVSGYYSFDLILKFSVLAQIDFIPGHLGFYYVPYNIHYANHIYSYSWKNNLPLLVEPEAFVKENVLTDKNNYKNSVITGDKQIGLVPIPDSDYQNKGDKEYRIQIYSNDYEDSNRFPFSAANANEAIGFLYWNLGTGTSGKAGTDASQSLTFSFIPLKKDGSHMNKETSISVTRENYADYPAFEGFYNITREYSGRSGGTLFKKIGYYVIEASDKALAQHTPFYSDEL